MLVHLKIKNIAVIETADVDFYDGLCVLTGETGAGKSILIDSISMLTGVRSNRELIRTGEEKAFVSGIFKPTEKVWKTLEKNGIFKSEDELLSVSRELNINGKSVCRINGEICPLSTLKSIGGYLINIHGQQDALDLYAPEKHILLLDKWCADELKPVLAKYREIYKKYISLAKESREISKEKETRDREIEYLEYEINEIASANITLGEENELIEKRTLYINREKIFKGVQEAINELFEANGSAREKIDISAKKMEALSKFSTDLEKISIGLRDALYALDDVKESLLQSNEFTGEAKLEEITDRLDTITHLKRKYGGSEEGILNHLENAEKRLEALKNMKLREGNLGQELACLKEEMEQEGEKLHMLREKFGKQLSAQIEDQLAQLNMQGSRFIVDIKKVPYGGLGCDGVEFLISPNKGEEVKPLSKIASGGELSRIMLAIKCIMAETDDASTYIFDEIDTGVSGRAAEKVAAKLKMVGETKQTLVISHLSHIAAAGKYHYRIDKIVENERTKTIITLLDFEGRIKEIARINSGSNLSEAAFMQAKEMLADFEK